MEIFDGPGTQAYGRSPCVDYQCRLITAARLIVFASWLAAWLVFEREGLSGSSGFSSNRMNYMCKIRETFSFIDFCSSLVWIFSQ